MQFVGDFFCSSEAFAGRGLAGLGDLCASWTPGSTPFERIECDARVVCVHEQKMEQFLFFIEAVMQENASSPNTFGTL